MAARRAVVVLALDAPRGRSRCPDAADAEEAPVCLETGRGSVFFTGQPSAIDELCWPAAGADQARTNGFDAFSAPIVVAGPWPGITRVSSGSV